MSGDAKFDCKYKRPFATVCGDAKFDWLSCIVVGDETNAAGNDQPSSWRL